MAKRSEAGGGVPALLVLLLVLVGGAAFNYHRNLQAESREPRPYRGYTEQELSDLMEAYEGRKEGQSERYQAQASRRVASRDKAYFDEQVREFERVQRAHRAKAEARDALAATQVVVKQIRAEQAKRAAERDKWMLFLRRAFTVDL
jgi:hypothetical protein